jgi:ABC-type transport system involved in multi-copper enzyme maturation permease subunit
MTIINFLIYGVAWIVVSFGLTLFIASAFFGIPKEISEEEYNDLQSKKGR